MIGWFKLINSINPVCETLILSTFSECLLFNFCLTSDKFQDRTCVQTPVETEIIRGIADASACSRTEGLSLVGSVWKRRCAHSLARWDVATPAPNWSLSPLSRLHILICICHICRGKKRHSGKSTTSQKKKRHSDINSLLCGFCMIVMIRLVCAASMLENMKTHPLVLWKQC